MMYTVAYLIESEYDDRESRKVERLITTTKFRHRAFIEEITASSSRNIDKNTIGRLSSCDFSLRNRIFLLQEVQELEKVL